MAVTRSKKRQLTIEENNHQQRRSTVSMRKMDILIHEAKHFVFGSALEWALMRDAFLETLVKKELQKLFQSSTLENAPNSSALPQS